MSSEVDVEYNSITWDQGFQVWLQQPDPDAPSLRGEAEKSRCSASPCAQTPYQGAQTPYPIWTSCWTTHSNWPFLSRQVARDVFSRSFHIWMILWSLLAIDAHASGTWKLLLCQSACRLKWQYQAPASFTWGQLGALQCPMSAWVWQVQSSTFGKRAPFLCQARWDTLITSGTLYTNIWVTDFSITMSSEILCSHESRLQSLTFQNKLLLQWVTPLQNFMHLH